MTKKSNGTHTFAAKLSKLLSENCSSSSNRAKVVSEKTSTERSNCIQLCFRELKAAGYRFDDPKSFANRHMKFLAEKWETDTLSASTIQVRLSHMRVFSTWIGKPGMVGPADKYVKNPESAARVYAATRDKTWSGNGIDPNSVLAKLVNEDVYAANQLKAVMAFGLRRKESICLHPHLADRGSYLSVNDGTKGGRARTVPIDTPYKRQILDELKDFVKNASGHLGQPNKSLQSNMRRLSYLMQKLGLTKEISGTTLHGLRHQYVNERFEEISGEPSPIRAGEVTKDNWPIVQKAALICAEEAGHARISITSAYFGKLNKNQK